jgi:lysophospholipid acyltransferase (LPLAT)-like uncharacterized protein
MKKIKLYILSIFMQWFLFIIFRTNKWHIKGMDKFERAINNNKPIMLCSWHARFLYAVYFFKKYKTQNIWAVSSTHEDSQIMAYFLKRASIKLIKGSSTRGWESVIKNMLKIFKNSSSIIAITNDGPKGPERSAKLGSYKIALKTGAQIISISCGSTKYWEIPSWDKLRLPKPFGEVYVEFSDPMEINKNACDINNADDLTLFLNNHLDALDNTIK